LTSHFIHRLCNVFLVLLFVAAAGCVPGRDIVFREKEEPVSNTGFSIPDFKDDLPVESLAASIERNIAYLDKLPRDHEFNYGNKFFHPESIKESQKLLLHLVKKYPDPQNLKKQIRRNFEILKASGDRKTGSVLFTGYYEPLFEAALQPDETFKHPIYSPPDDMIRIDLGLFNPRFKGDYLTARIDGRDVLPYHSRSDIENARVLKGRGLEIAWLKDPVDVAFLHIQGSGRLKLPDGSILTAGYAAKNGHPYRSIGAYLLEQGKINRENLSMQSIRSYLAANPEEVKTLLDYNPSYVFFRILEGPVVGNIGVPLTPERSIALDAEIFPKGALCFISTRKPRLGPEGDILAWESFSAFVLNQDTGGAIKGPGRADIFWGSGAYAETAAGHLKHQGELYLLVKKP
jgi:membrane-bound lytic murein transglycosylase A